MVLVNDKRALANTAECAHMDGRALIVQNTIAQNAQEASVPDPESANVKKITTTGRVTIVLEKRRTGTFVMKVISAAQACAAVANVAAILTGGCFSKLPWA